MGSLVTDHPGHYTVYDENYRIPLCEERIIKVKVVMGRSIPHWSAYASRRQLMICGPGDRRSRRSTETLPLRIDSLPIRCHEYPRNPKGDSTTDGT
jgi:hypothetical protein